MAGSDRSYKDLVAALRDDNIHSDALEMKLIISIAIFSIAQFLIFQL